jgi:hypothetical protein
LNGLVFWIARRFRRRLNITPVAVFTR